MRPRGARSERERPAWQIILCVVRSGSAARAPRPCFGRRAERAASPMNEDLMPPKVARPRRCLAAGARPRAAGPSRAPSSAAAASTSRGEAPLELRADPRRREPRAAASARQGARRRNPARRRLHLPAPRSRRRPRRDLAARRSRAASRRCRRRSLSTTSARNCGAARSRGRASRGRRRRDRPLRRPLGERPPRCAQCRPRPGTFYPDGAALRARRCGNSGVDDGAAAGRTRQRADGGGARVLCRTAAHGVQPAPRSRAASPVLYKSRAYST